MDQYSRTPDSGCSFLPLDQWPAIDDASLPTSEMQAPAFTPKTLADQLKESSTIKRLVASGMTVAVWSERPGIEPELEQYESPPRYTRAEWDHREGRWTVRGEAAVVSVHWGAWLGLGGRVAKPTKLVGLWGPTGGPGARAGAMNGGGGPGAAGPSQTPRQG